MTTRRAVAVGLVCFALLGGAGGALAQDEDFDEDLDDILGGFEEEDGLEVDREAIADTQERWWDLSGSVEISASVNYRSHESATGTDFGGLQRLRNRLNLQFDADLPHDWKARIEGWFFYDMAFLINGRGDYTTQVRNDYELDWDFREVYVQGKLHERLDAKIGRQIVIWGRSETLRVLDVINPLDNREPGRVDLEDLRRPLAMGRLDAFAGDWTFTFLAIPEIRFDETPRVGSDFVPVGKPPGLPPRRDPDSFTDWELAGSITGIFSGWDISFHGAWFFNDQPLATVDLSVPGLFFGEQTHPRLWLVGTGGNYTVGGWLFKGELAYLDGFSFERAVPRTVPPLARRVRKTEKGRVDALVGVEYYGFTDTTITLEGVNRWIPDYGASVRRAGAPQAETQQELALRITRNFMNERLEVTGLATMIRRHDEGDPFFIFRFNADYDIRDALVFTAGILIFQEGDFGPFDKWGQNDRFFFNLKWSF